VIEKHLTFSRKMYGSDAANSCEPEQFAELVAGIREISLMMQHFVDKDDTSELAEMKKVFEKSVVSTNPIPRGALIEADMVAIKKPGTGIPPSRIATVIGSRAARDIPADSVITEEDISLPRPAADGDSAD
jgi:N-acetylneuraminate synthase